MSKHQTILPTLEEFEEIKRLPVHIPGRIITLSLAQLPLYLEVNNLKPAGVSATGAMLVKQDEDPE
jgi:hypothetical protein